MRNFIATILIIIGLIVAISLATVPFFIMSIYYLFNDIIHSNLTIFMFFIYIVKIIISPILGFFIFYVFAKPASHIYTE